MKLASEAPIVALCQTPLCCIVHGCGLGSQLRGANLETLGCGHPDVVCIASALDDDFVRMQVQLIAYSLTMMIPSRSCSPVTGSHDINIWSRDIHRIKPYLLGTGFTYACAGDGRMQSVDISVKQTEECGGACYAPS